MHVICSNCAARYAVNPAAIGPVGRVVQCVRCSHRWFENAAGGAGQTASEFASASPIPDIVIRPSMSAANLPAIATPPIKSRKKPWLIALACFVVVAGLSALAFRAELGALVPAEWRSLLTWNSLDTWHSPAGNGGGNEPGVRALLALDTSASRVELVDGRFVVHGEVVNRGGTTAVPTALKVVFRDDGKILGERSYALVEKPILPGRRARISQVLDEPPAGATNIIPTIE